MRRIAEPAPAAKIRQRIFDALLSGGRMAVHTEVGTGAKGWRSVRRISSKASGIHRAGQRGPECG